MRPDVRKTNTCRARRRAWSLVAALAALLPLAGCSGAGGGRLTLSGANRTTLLTGDFTTGVFRFDDENHLTAVLFDGPPDHPRQAATVRLFWSPRAGRTPIDRTATNATIHYVIATEGAAPQLGIYSGAGFVYPELSKKRDELSGAVWQADVRLSDATPGFEDLLGQSLLQGEFTARRDDAAVQEALRRLEVLARARLAYPRLVDAAPAARRGRP